MHLRKDSARFYACPEPDFGQWTLRLLWEAMWWHLGFDPLSIRQRLVKVRQERDYWKGAAAEVVT